MTTQTFRRKLWKTPMRDLVRLQVTGRLDLDELLREADLPEAVASTVRTVVKHTRLWRFEKIDVAHELIAHFRDGLDHEMSADELIKHFGDERVAARLIRRAKQRQRSLVWQALMWSRRAVAALFVVYLGMFVYFMSGSPEVKVDYIALFNQRAAAVPVDERAWPLYREALVALDLDREREWDTPIPYYDDLSPEEQEEYAYELSPPFRGSMMNRLKLSLSPDKPGWSSTAAFLRDNAVSLALIREGGMRSGMGLAAGFPEDFSPADRSALQIEVNPDAEGKTFQHPDKALIGVWLPHLGKVRNMARLLAADARLAASEGDAARVYDNLQAIQGLADHCLESPCLIGELIGIATRSTGYVATSDILTQYPDQLADDQLRQLAHHYAGSDLSLAIGSRGEKLWLQDIVQRIYTDDGQGDGRITPEGIEVLHSALDSISYASYIEHEYMRFPSLEEMLGPVTMLSMASRKELNDKYEQMLGAHAEEASKPLWERPKLNMVGEQIESWTTLEQSRFAVLKVLMPAMGVVVRTGEVVRGQREGILLGIALELHRRDTGDWPATLDVLSPQYLPRLPVDRLTGKPLTYRITDSGPLIYSIGVDGDDDGGRPPVDPDTGEAANREASPRYYREELRTDPKHDGDWVLWPMPDQQ